MSLNGPINTTLSAYIKEYARKPQRAVSLHQMIVYGERLSDLALFNGSVFLREEIPIRLARRITDLDSMPNGLCENPLVKQVRDLFLGSFQDCMKLPLIKYSFNNDSSVRPYNPINAGSHLNMGEFNYSVYETLKTIKSRHDNVVEVMARGVQNYVKSDGKSVSKDLQRFLEDFYTSRIGIRCLIGHHLALFEQLQQNSNSDSWVGIICQTTNVLQVCQNALNDALFIFENKYGPFTSPKVSFHTTEKKPELRYIPSHLHHMIFELIKNSLRATYETHQSSKNILPDIKIIVSEGSEDITIKVTDEGGGIPRSAEKLLWSFGYTTAELRSEDTLPLAGFGYGLPLSRLYARYFGGDLKVISMDGYGTDAYLQLRRLPDSIEPIIS